MSPNYYAGREASLAEIFGATTLTVAADAIEVDGQRLPVIDDVIITLPPERQPPMVRERLGSRSDGTRLSDFADDIQFTFGAEWTDHGDILPEHRQEFDAYFDLVDIATLYGKRVADLGCGSGRWATFVAPHCREIVLADFSEAIFVARRNLGSATNAIFVLADVTELPFGDDAFDFSYCLGVLHHLPVDALDACRALARLGPDLLVYLYYALDNRPVYYRMLLAAVTPVRRRLARVRNRSARNGLSLLIAATVYAPLAMLGKFVGPRARRFIPLADTYVGKSLRRLQQDAYDRFFTSIEQRHTKAQIGALRDTFADIQFSADLPYWHFRCRR